MENAGYVGLSYQLALERKMDTLSNNIANMDTAGYKSQHIKFEEHISSGDPTQPISMVSDNGAYKNLTSGPISVTGNALDVALVGNGFLNVRDPSGANFYTRNGHMQINANNQLVTTDGNLVLGRGGSPIVIPDGETDIKITPDGLIAGKQGQIAELAVMSFDNPQLLEAKGNNLYSTEAQAKPDIITRIQQGALEGSNVSPILEMTDMMKVQRSYESVARMLQTDHDRQRDAIRKLSQTN